MIPSILLVKRRLAVAVLSFVSLLALGAPLFAQAPAAGLTAEDKTRVAQAGAYIDKALAEMQPLLTPDNVIDIHPKSVSLGLAIKFLQTHGGDLLTLADGKLDVPKQLQEIGHLSEALSKYSDGGNLQESGDQVYAIQKDWDAIKQALPTGTFAEKLAPPFYACIMHPRQTNKQAGVCPVCGMALVPRPAFQAALAEAHGPAIFAQVKTDAPMEVGHEVHAVLSLRTPEGKPVKVNDLTVAHTQPIHLLIIDQSLSDYHHEHPKPLDTPGDYAFSFTPAKPGAYRVFADIVPAETGLQEYAQSDIMGSGQGEPIGDHKRILETVVDGLRYKLSFDRDHLVEGEPATGMLDITDAATGAPFTKLEPVMATFGHFVGFHEDHVGILHIHPKGPDPVPQGTFGGPRLEFQFTPTKAGFFRFYTQVQVNGVSKFPMFALTFEKQAEPVVAEKGTAAK